MKEEEGRKGREEGQMVEIGKALDLAIDSTLKSEKIRALCDDQNETLKQITGSRAIDAPPPPPPQPANRSFSNKQLPLSVGGSLIISAD